MAHSHRHDVGKIAELERLSLHAWPALTVESFDGWLLRYAAGITRRANSVWPNEIHGDLATELRVAKVEEFYHARNLPARFQLCPASEPANLDELLQQRGYRVTARTAVQATSLDAMYALTNGNPALTVELTEKPTSRWWECYANGDGVGEESLTIRKKICDAIAVDTTYALVTQNGQAIAVGSAAREGEWIGFFNIATRPEHRRAGAARSAMSELAKWGLMKGASKTYIQVMADNVPALTLYSQLGFITEYYYYYREEINVR